ncbi:hypothetical protein E1264_03785 [Actinomadura sp. KC216]|uniref:hypothetical protein n=1 Tax=Actinomadura sp. KC216 TaxID=2530370 RepID=UPI001052409F|nr:hypothetical protein [Actinomadura sp. KC216]TDB90936.1 hypothetical protein E1264_03785 [Actinomadura sp. KC216]
MKLEVVPLPEQRIGDAAGSPYLLVISEVGDYLLNLDEAEVEKLKEDIGAAGVLFFEDPVEVVK